MNSRTLAEIDVDIQTVQTELENVKGTTCEVYARIVGYYRSVRNWNPGKRDEFNKRVMFSPTSGVAEHLAKTKGIA